MKINNQTQKLLTYIESYSHEFGFPPTMREMKKALDFKSISTVSYYLDKLQEQGHIKKQANRNRALELTSRKLNNSSKKLDEITLPNNIEKIDTSNLIAIPVLGKITAGEPILAVQNCEEYFMVSPNMFRGEDLFMLNVSGESMINAGIYNGDKVVIRQQSSANNGDIVAAMIDGMATVKRFYKENGHYRLQPENDTMSPIFADNVEILGKVVGLVRNF